MSAKRHKAQHNFAFIYDPGLTAPAISPSLRYHREA